MRLPGAGFDRAKLTTGNGRVEYEGSAGELKASSGNGAINVEMKGAGDWEFSTGNGRISIGVVRDGDTGYEMDLTARAGGITVEGLDDADVIEDVAISRSRWRYKARTPGFEQAGAKGRIKAHNREWQDSGVVLKGEPGMEQERLRILQMLKDGKVTVDEALKLLEALEAGAVEAEPVERPRARWFKIRITERGQDKPKVMVNLPVGLVDWALKTGNKFMALGGAEMENIDLNQLRLALLHGGTGKIIDVVDDEDGTHVEISLE